MRLVGVLLLQLLLALSLAESALAHRCGFDSKSADKRESAAWRSRADHFRNRALASKKRGASTTYTIPVYYIHVYDATTPYVSNASMEAQTQVLNEDFNKQNSDIANVESEFTSRTASALLNFETVGIKHINVSNASYTVDGGPNGVPIMEDYPPEMPTQRALTIYVTSLKSAGSILGYAQFPWGDNATDVIVDEASVTHGRKPNSTSQYNLGRTAVHEVGHWLGLRHIWGDGQDTPQPCDYDDFVADTPNADDPHYSCGAVSSCGSKDMYQNFMDYMPDVCGLAFTEGQVARMRSHLDDPYGWRRTLVVPDCGNSVIDGAEECDDGNNAMGDGCFRCAVETGWSCPTPSGACVRESGLKTVYSCATVPGEVIPEGWVSEGAEQDFSIINGRVYIDMQKADTTNFVRTEAVTLPASATKIYVSASVKYSTEQSAPNDAVCFDWFSLDVLDTSVYQSDAADALWDPLKMGEPLHGVIPRRDTNTAPYFQTGYCNLNSNFASEWQSLGMPAIPTDYTESYDITHLKGKTVKLQVMTKTDDAAASSYVQIGDIKIEAITPGAVTAATCQEGTEVESAASGTHGAAATTALLGALLALSCAFF